MRNGKSYVVPIGSMVRLYGFVGRFRLQPIHGRASYSLYDAYAVPEGCDARRGFPIVASSIVEVDGKPCAMRSCPLADVASDYPHEPQFAYDDGPEKYGEIFLRRWRERREGMKDPAEVCGRLDYCAAGMMTPKPAIG